MGIRAGGATHLALIGALAALAALVPGETVSAAQEYDFFLVEAFEPDYDLREVTLRDINESGYATGTSTHQGYYDGFLWTQATDKTVVPILWPQGINNQNQIVGGGQILDFETGDITNVPPAGGWPITRLMAINDNGVAVGYSECSCSNSDRTLQSALVWDALQGSRTIPVPAAKELLRINNAGFAVGNIRGGSAGSEGFFYDVEAGTHANLTDHLPPYQYGRGWSELQDVNEVNVVCGRGWDGQMVRGLTWSPPSQEGITFLPPIPGGLPDRVYPRGINASGAVVGFADLTLHNPRAFIWDEVNGTRNLNDLVQAPSGFILDWAVKINDQGWIVGIGHYGPGWGTSRGFVLEPRGLATSVPGGERAVSSAELRVLGNPVTDRLVIEYAVPQDRATRITLFDAAGRQVLRVLDGRMPAGVHTVAAAPPRSLGSGVYFARLEAGEWSATTRFVLVR